MEKQGISEKSQATTKQAAQQVTSRTSEIRAAHKLGKKANIMSQERLQNLEIPQARLQSFESSDEIKIFAYPRSFAQAALLLNFADYLIFGAEPLAMRLPHSFSRKEQARLALLCHKQGKGAIAAVNGMLHNREIAEFTNAYLPFLLESGFSGIMTGDPGVIDILQEIDYDREIIWDTQTLNTSSGNLNFWAGQGVTAALLAAELPRQEIAQIREHLRIPALVQVYGAVGVQVSGRYLLTAYGKHLAASGVDSAARGVTTPVTRNVFRSSGSKRLGLQEQAHQRGQLLPDWQKAKPVKPKKPLCKGPVIDDLTFKTSRDATSYPGSKRATYLGRDCDDTTTEHKTIYRMIADEPGSGPYSLYEDQGGTQIFADQDLNLMPKLAELYDMGVRAWTLSGLFVPDEAYIAIVATFREAAQLLEQGEFTPELAAQLERRVEDLHPSDRQLGLGFYALDPQDIE